MTDLEARLRADAARPDPGPVPDLHHYLDRVVGSDDDTAAPPVALELVDDRLPRTSRRAATWLAAAAVVLLAAGAGAVALAARDSAPDRSARPAAPADLPSTRGDTVLRWQDPTGFDLAARVPGDDRALDVLVPYSRAVGSCSVFSPRVAVHESAARVVVVVSGYRYVEPDGDGYSCGADASDTETILRVRLDAPLGDREVLDASLAGQEAQVGVIDPGAVPTPAYVPAGYFEFASDRVDVRAGVYGSERQYAAGDNQFTVTGSPMARLEGGDPSRHEEVNGHPARYSHDSGCLYWLPRPGYAYTICVTGPRPLSREQVLMIAGSVR